MKNLSKVNSWQIFEIWKNISAGLLTVIAVIIASKFLPFYFSPIVGLVGAAVLFTLLYQNKMRQGVNCMLIPYSMFFGLIVYSFVSILVNVLYIWGLLNLPDEFIFFNDPYIPTLWLVPIMFFSLLAINTRRRRLQLCVDCRLQNGSHSNRGLYGSIIGRESKIQLRNLIWLFGVLSVVVWTYYLIKYQSFNTNAKDRYIFFWIAVITLSLDIFYFLYRYFNLYLDLKDNDELITKEDLVEVSGKTYIRYYVICGNDLYLCPNKGDATNPTHSGLDTPFFTSLDTLHVSEHEALEIIQKQTGVKDGELRFFYGRKTPDIANHKVLRYFYFLNGSVDNYHELPEPGLWIDFEEIKKIYSLNPEMLSTMTVSDISRLATIMVTEKTYKESGQRKLKLKSYQPTFDLIDVRESPLNFHDNKWLKIAVYNSDNRFFRIKRWWNKVSGLRKTES